MINTKSSLKHRLMAVRFAIWDLHLYLDTHCNDEEATELIKKYMEKYCGLLKEYRCKYGPLTADEGHAEPWVKTPFPWVNSGSDC